MVKNKDWPDSGAHPQSGLSLSLSPLFLSPTLFILRVPLDPAQAGPRHLLTPVPLPLPAVTTKKISIYYLMSSLGRGWWCAQIYPLIRTTALE